MDHASTTPLDPKVFSAMEQVYKNNYYNPGALYREAVETKKIISESRKSVAKLIGTTSDHVVFTRGGTESNNLAIFGILQKWKNHDTNTKNQTPHIIISEIEHAAVLESVKDLEKKGEIELSLAPVTGDGIVDVDELKKLLKPNTILVSVMYVNNEIGTIQPIKDIAKLLRWYKKHRPHPDPLLKGEGAERYPLLHTDAIQAGNYLDINVERLGIDLMSLSGSKIYGPKSSGVLYIRNRELVAPLLHGGEQEFGLRAGTEDIAQVVGFTKALEIARATAESENARLFELQNYFFAELKKNIPDVIVNGAHPLLIEEGAGGGGFIAKQSTTPHSPPPQGGDAARLRIPNNINISIPGISGERIIIELDAKGISASSKSACKEDNGEESHVIAAIRKQNPHPDPLPKGDRVATEGSVRFTMGRGTTKSDVEKAVLELVKIVNKIKEFENNLT